MEIHEFKPTPDTIDVFASGAIGGVLSWMLGEKKRSPWEALAIIIGGAFTAEYLTEAVLAITKVELPDRAIGFMLGVLGMRALDVVIGVLEQVAQNPKEVLGFIVEYVTKKFRLK